MLNLIKILELQMSLEKNGDDHLRLKGLYNALNTLTVELGSLDGLDLKDNLDLELLNKEVQENITEVISELKAISPYILLTDSEKVSLAAEIFVDFDRVGYDLTIVSYEKYLNGEIRSKREDKRSVEYITTIFGDYDTAMDYYNVFRVRNNMDNR